MRRIFCFFSLRFKTENSELNAKLTNVMQIKEAAEAKLADFEREKMMIELDIKEIIARHKTEVTERMAWSSKVCTASRDRSCDISLVSCDCAFMSVMTSFFVCR